MILANTIFLALATLCQALDYPSLITVRTGVLLASPFAMSSENGEYYGFIPDLLNRLKTFAESDGVELKFDLMEAPPQYNNALDLIANDCNATANPNSVSDCSKFDIIAGDYYVNPSRSVRVDFSPTWLRTTMTTISKSGLSKTYYGTLAQLEAANGTVCVPGGTFLMSVAMDKFSDANFYTCPTPIDCIEKLKAEQCNLYVDDELLLRYWALNDDTLQLNRDNFNTQYLVWPMSYNMNKDVSILLKKWIYAAIVNNSIDELYYTYFARKLCPIGTAGVNCTEPCHPKHGEADLTGKCVCDSTKWTGPNCSIEVMQNTNLIPVNLKAAGYSLYGILVVITLSCFLWLYSHKNTAQVKSIQPFFLYLILLGCLLASSTIVVLAQESEEYVPVHVCMLGPWLYSIGSCITFGTLFAKIRRVHIIFRNSSRMIRTTITVKETVFKIAFILLVDIAILSTWTIVDPLHWVRQVTIKDKYGDPLASQGHCTCNNAIPWITLLSLLHFSVLIMASYMCYVARHISSRFSEAKYLKLAIYSNTQVYLLGVPVVIITRDDPSARFFVTSIIIFFDVIIVLGCIFGNLIYRVICGEEDQGSDIGVAISTYMRRSSEVGSLTTFKEKATSRMWQNRSGSAESIQSCAADATDANTGGE